MELKHVVVDGSNIATEGRSLPSLKQLDEAVRTFLAENPTEHVTVIVDATFGHRIDASERAEYEEAILAGELITPPAGAIGRGDKFVLQIADRANASILSNDSFQEFHGEYTWLFEEGRLIGGKPVPGVGWVFLLRTPVRGPASRRSVRDARNSGGSTVVEPGRSRRGGGRRRRTAGTAAAPGAAAADVVEAVVAQVTPEAPRASIAPINDPLPFIEFVANHPVGSRVEGEVERFASHGAYVRAGGARCYVGLKFMGDPAPRSAKDVLNLGEVRTFAVHAFDTPRRGIDLALAVPTEGPARAVGAEPAPPAGADGRQRRGRRSAAPTPPANATGQEGSAGRAPRSRRDSNAGEGGREEVGAPNAATARVAGTKAPTTTSSTATKTAVDNAQEAPVTPVKKAVAKKAPAKKRAVAKKAPAKKKAVAKKAPAKKAVAKRAPAKKAAVKKAAVKRAPAKKAAVKKAAVKKATARKTAARATTRAATSRATTTRTTTARVAAVRKAPAKRAVTKRAPARRSG
jgi:hypothetical protein